MKTILIYIVIVLLSLCSVRAQKVFIDQPIRVGDVTVFPTVDDPNAYYYLPDNPRLARTREGKPQFSFLFFTEKNRSGVTEQNIEEQISGGIVHALVEYGLTNDEVSTVRTELKQLNGNATIKGPIIYQTGNLGLVSAIADGSSGFVKKIIGVGKAPVLEGNKAAISFMLNDKGARLLWSTFQTETPDVSFSFEMEMAGYLTPIKAWVKGNYDQIYEAHQMQLAGSGSLGGVVTFGAEIGATFDKLRKDGKLEVYSEGDDVEMKNLLEIGYKKIADAMFEPVGESYAQMVNNDPNKIESGMTQLTQLADLQSKQLDNSKKSMEMAEWQSKQKKKEEQKSLEDTKTNLNEKKRTDSNKKIGLNGQKDDTEANVVIVGDETDESKSNKELRKDPDEDLIQIEETRTVEAPWANQEKINKELDSKDDNSSPIKETPIKKSKKKYKNPCDNPNNVDFDISSNGERCMDKGRLLKIIKWCDKNIEHYNDESYSSKQGIKVYPNTIKIYDKSIVLNNPLQVGRKHFELIYESRLLHKFIKDTDSDLQKQIKLISLFEKGTEGNLEGSKLTDALKNIRGQINYLVQKEKEATKKYHKAKKIPRVLINLQNLNLLEQAKLGYGYMLDDAKTALRKIMDKTSRKIRTTQSNSGEGGPNPNDYFDFNSSTFSYLDIENPFLNAPAAPFSIFATYRFRQTKLEGNFEINLNKVSADTRFIRFDENIGNIKAQCESCFKVVPLDEMEMTKQREVLFILDGAILSNFKKFINSASITMIKEYSNGKADFESTNITYTNFKNSGNVSKMVYGWQEGDTNPWKDYKYKVKWNFFQNYNHEQEYEDDADVVTISPPVTLKTVRIEADPDFVNDNNIKYITLSVSYDYGDRIQNGYVDFDSGGQFVTKPIRLRADGILSKQIGLILPNNNNEFSYTYEVTTNDGKRYKSPCPIVSNDLMINGIDQIPDKEDCND